MNIIVCDDNNIQLEIFKDFFREYQAKTDLSLNYFSTGEDGIDYINKQYEDGLSVDVAFLDVEMHGKSGIDVGKVLKVQNPDGIIVFVTGYKDHAVSAFKLRALDYLLKPVTDEALDAIMQEIEGLYNDQIARKAGENFYSFETKNETVRVPYQEIVLFEKVNRKIRLVTANGTYEYIDTFKNVVDEIDMDLFCQCHQSFIINKSSIREVVNNEIIISEYGLKIPINRASKSVIKKIMREKGSYL